MHLETTDRKAFDHVTEALACLDRFKYSKSYDDLQEAKTQLEQAHAQDPAYLRPVYYGAMVSDLLGSAKDAIGEFEKVLLEHPPFAEEVRYNLAVAYYHRYSKVYLDRAVELFTTVVANSENNQALNLLARAGLAQTYAMRMIPPDFTKPDRDSVAEGWRRSDTEYQGVMRALSNIRLDDETSKDIAWAAHNARGMSLMYYSDYHGTLDERIRYLHEALDWLEKANQDSPRNWANYCDLGSAHMRLGHWTSLLPDQPKRLWPWKRRSSAQPASIHFDKALSYLAEVIESLRPGYGFALYEIGRTYRLMGEFDKAMQFLDRSLAIARDYRDIGDTKIKLEKELIRARSTEYPWQGTSGL